MGSSEDAFKNIALEMADSYYRKRDMKTLSSLTRNGIITIQNKCAWGDMLIRKLQIDILSMARDHYEENGGDGKEKVLEEVDRDLYRFFTGKITADEMIKSALEKGPVHD